LSNQLRAVVTADVKRFVSSMDVVGGSAGAAASIAVAAFATITSAIITLDKAVINATKNYETLRIRLQLLSGNMKAGAREFEALKTFAENSAFATDKVISGYIRLRAVAGKKFATEHIENIAFASKVAGTSLEGMAARVGELVLRIRSGLTGGLLARSLRTFGTAFGEEATLDLVKMAQAGERSEVILDRVEMALGRLGKQAKVEFSNSIEGLEQQLDGLKTKVLADLGGGSEDTYKKALQEFIGIAQSLNKTNAFDELGKSLAFMNKEFAAIVATDDFRQFLLDVMIITAAIARSIGLITKGIGFVKSVKVSEFAANPGSALGAAFVRGLMGGEVSADLARMNASRERAVADDAKKTANNTGVTANGIDPAKEISGDR